MEIMETENIEAYTGEANGAECRAEFFWEAKETVIDGKKEIRDVPLIQIFIDERNTIHREIKEPYERNVYVQRYPLQWKAFMDGGQQVQGTPLSVVSFIKPATIQKLALIGIESVEQLIATPTSQVSGVVMDGGTLQAKAEQWLNAFRTTADAEAVKAKEEALQGKIEDLESKLASVLGKLEEKESKPKRAKSKKKDEAEE